MVNLAILIGNGYFGEDILQKKPYLNHIQNNHDIYISSRIDPKVHLSKNSKKLLGDTWSITKKNIEDLEDITSFIYDSKYLNTHYSDNEIFFAQKWLGISFSYIASFDRKFYNKNKKKESRDLISLKNYITGLTNYFNDFFSINQIDVLLNSIEDTLFPVVAYYVAKRLGITILGQMNGRFPKKGVFFCENFNKLKTWKKEYVDFNEILDLYDLTTIVGEQTLAKNQNYWSFFSLPKKINDISKVISYRKTRKKIIEKYNYEKLILEPVFYSTNKYIKGFPKRFILKKFLKKCKKNENFFLFPLHYMDDAQITFREPLKDQFYIIEVLSRALPLNYKLYVKPHPHYFGTDVNLKDINKIAKLKNVKIIDPSYPPVELIKKSEGLITLNSTTGFEAMIFKKPVLSLGNEFYSKSEFSYQLDDINSLSEILMKMISGNKNNLKIENFIKNVYNNTIWISGKNLDYGHGITKSDGEKIGYALNKILSNTKR